MAKKYDYRKEIAALKALPADEFMLDANADRIVDLAASNFDPRMSQDERERVRESIQDAVDALIDVCRDYYTKLAVQ